MRVRHVSDSWNKHMLRTDEATRVFFFLVLGFICIYF